MHPKTADFSSPFNISEEDILQAMKDIQGYLDISPGDFKEVFQVAYRHAVARIMESRKAVEIMSKQVQCVDLAMDLRQAATFLAVRMGVGETASFMEIIAHCLNNKGCVATVLRNHDIRDIMTQPAITAGPEITVAAISALFIDKRINRLPIIDSNDRPVGIVTRTDLVNSYCFSR